MGIFIWFWVFFFPAVAGADCTPVNLYEGENSPFRSDVMPIYDQDGDGLCYAYTAKQMIDYHHLKKNPDLMKQKPVPLTSVHWLAFAHKYEDMGKFTLGPTKGELPYSVLSAALNDFRKTGTCSEETVKAGIERLKVSEQLTNDEFLYLFNLFYKGLKKEKERQKAERQKQKDDYLRTGNSYPAYLDEEPTLDDQVMENVFKSALFQEHEKPESFFFQRSKDFTPEANVVNGTFVARDKDGKEKQRDQDRIRLQTESGFYEDGGSNECPKDVLSNRGRKLFQNMLSMIKEDQERKQLDTLKETVFADCFKPGARSPVEVPEFRDLGKGYASNEKILGAIDDALENQEPAGIGYCAKVFSEAGMKTTRLGALWRQVLPRVGRLAARQNCSPHYSLTVGRRPGANGCEYLVRNTYGDFFWNSNPNTVCLCEKRDGGKVTGTMDCTYAKDGHKREGVRVLGCWISGEKLADHTFNVTAFK